MAGNVRVADKSLWEFKDDLLFVLEKYQWMKGLTVHMTANLAPHWPVKVVKGFTK